MIFRALLINIIGQAGIEHAVHALFQQLSHVTVHELCGVTDSVGGDGELSLFICPAGAHLGKHDLEAERSKDAVPQGEQLIYAKPQGQTDAPASWSAALHCHELVPLEFIEIRDAVPSAGDAEPSLAAVAGNLLPAAGEGVHGKAAVICALAAGSAL